MTRKIRYRERVRALKCAICQLMDLGETPAETHHALDGAAHSDYLLIPLCKEHHSGATGFHGLGQRAFEMRYNTTEANLLAWVNEKLA